MWGARRLAARLNETRRHLRQGGRRACLGMLVTGFSICAGASGPRYVSGYPYYTGQGKPVVWAQTGLTYFTDPGGLGTHVNHAAADALVAAAAGVWNVPVANITVSQGGALAEHVSGGNVYLGTNGMVWPADVGSGNSATVPISVVYDTDGSVTDLLLGSGASNPGSCRQNAALESVDQFDPAGYIQHAIIVLNGRCTGAAPELQLQMQYELERVFGRVLGLAWSQANDNVFTGTPVPTYDQAMHWPILHPLDIICGAYSYQCLPSPFELRPDDIAGMVLLYPIAGNATPSAGKQVSLQSAMGAAGQVTFSTGQGMAGVNVLVQREGSYDHALEGWIEGSAATGTLARRNGRSPFVAQDASPMGSEGSNDRGQEGVYFLAWLPLQEGETQQTVVVSTEPVNSLYMGTHSVEPYSAGVVEPSGSAPAAVTIFQGSPGGDVYASFVASDSAATCGTGLDGTLAAPAPAGASGWWTGLICGYGHTSYASLNVQPGRSLTVEVTALDEQGFATTAKLMPVVGIYAPTDQSWNLPSVAVAPGAFQARALGMTSLAAQSGTGSSAVTQLRIAIADQRGDGRPDFAYQARTFYADSMVPARLPAAGGTVTISGMGFRAGNPVTVNGVTAVVTSWSTTAIMVTMPTMAAAGAVNQVAVDVQVSDLSTGATSTMTAALTYDTSATLPNVMKLVSAPAGNVTVGSVAVTRFAVQVVKADGVTPVAGEQVAVSAAMGQVQWSVCGGAACTLTTDAAGMISSAVTPLAVGTVTLQAVDGPAAQSATFNAQAGDGSLILIGAPSGNISNGTMAQVPFAVRALSADGTTGVANRLVTFTVTSGSAMYGPCAAASCAVSTDGSGNASVTVTPEAMGTVTLQASDGVLKQRATFVSTSNADTMQVVNPPPASASTFTSVTFSVRLLHADGVTPDGYERMVFTTSGGALIYPCAAAVCSANGGGDGIASVTLTTAQTGTFTITAAYGAVVQSATVTFDNPGSKMNLISAPSAVQTEGAITDKPFTIQLLFADGTPMANAGVVMSGPVSQVMLGGGCNRSACLLNADANGIASATVTPLVAGRILVTAQFGSLSQSISFAAVSSSDTMTVLSSPGAGTFTGDTESFRVQVMLPDGVTPAVGKTVIFSVANGSFAFSGCGGATCPVTTGANGQAAIAGVALAAGGVTVVAADGAVTQAMNFSTTAHADVMRLVGGPTGNVFVGSMGASPFAVQVFLQDGVTPAVGRAITFAVTVGSARFSACAVAPCAVVTDARGMASAFVTPLAAGATDVVAADGSASEAIAFTAVTPPYQLTLESAPVGNIFAGTKAGTAFAVRVLFADGITPAPGVTVTFSNGGAGQVQFGICGSGACTVQSDSGGMVSSAISGTTPGAALLVASLNASADGVSLSAAVNVVASQESLNALNPMIYIAQGASFPLLLSANAVMNGGPAAGQGVAWGWSGNLSLSSSTTTTDGTGGTEIQAIVGPLSAGGNATATACAWSAVCTTFRGVGVATTALTIQVVSGAAQVVGAGGTPVAVTASVSDGAGDPVAGASVTVYQTVRAVDVPCPVRGRCPAAPVLTSGESVLVSDINGMVSVMPLCVSGVATDTSLLLTVGTQGAASADAVNQP